MDELRQIYERISYLRAKGIKMKDIAESTQMVPSVLSALYSTVLPAYVKNRDKGMDIDDALDASLVWVNNISKKKLLNMLPKLKEGIFNVDMTVKSKDTNTVIPFIETLVYNLHETVNRINTFSGIYMSYSISSSSNALKIEPYLIAPSDDGNYIEVGHNNAYGSTHWGAAFMNGTDHLYLMFNEKEKPQMALFNICLKLPMFDNPKYLKGVYTCLDYNYNPIARRILFVKMSDKVSRSEFLKIKGEVKTEDKLSDIEKAYFHYTCQKEDVICMCAIPAPQMNEQDLILEKKILSI